MTKELEELEYLDTVVDFCMACQKNGARTVLQTLRYCDKAMFDEIKVQINRMDVPALFLKNARSM